MQRADTSHNLYLRWTWSERAQHWVLATSFIVLVITGFALKYPDSWWTWPFTLTKSFDLRGLLHRIAATLYILLSIYHIGYLLLSARGRAQVRALMLRWQDFIDMKMQMLYNLGKSRKIPKYGHFTYWEKMEYWALVWGTLVMVCTGLILWFENISLKIFPLWVMDISTVIHFYEAILASLAILVWHFYFVIFSPTVYPLNTSMLDGYITRKEMEEEHAGELEEIERRLTSSKSDAQSKDLLESLYIPKR